MGATISKINWFRTSLDPTKFRGLSDYDMFYAYKAIFSKALVQSHQNASVLCGGIENLYFSPDYKIVFVGPLGIEIGPVIFTSKNKKAERKYVTKLHPVLRLHELRELIKRPEVQQVLIQVLLPHHTGLLVFSQGQVRFVDSNTQSFGWEPDIISALEKNIPWRLLFPEYEKNIQLYTYVCEPPVNMYCALATITCVKQLILEKNWDLVRKKLSILSVTRQQSTKEIFIEKLGDQAGRLYFCDTIMKFFRELVDIKVITNEHFSKS